jgi:hypothetical protein
VAILVAIAAVDAIRNRGDSEPSTEGVAAPSDLADQAGLVARLRNAGVAGTLVYTDDLCALRGVELPSLRRAPHPAGLSVGCDSEVSRDSLRVAPGRAVWSRSPPAYAICRGAVVDVYVPPSGRPEFQYDGCVPAWRPREPSSFGSNVLTVVRNGAVLEVRPVCEGQPPCERTLVPRRTLEAATRRHLNAPDGPADVAVVVRGAAWLDANRLAVALSARFVSAGRRLGPFDLVALIDRGRVVTTHERIGDPVVGLAASARGRYLAVPPDAVLRDDLREVPLPDSFGPVRALAISPDERWVALAARGAVMLVDLPAAERSLALPIAARNLNWR